MMDSMTDSMISSVCDTARWAHTQTGTIQNSIITALIDEVPFRSKYTFEERCGESGRVLRKYPHRIPVVCERDNRCQNVSTDNKKKFLVPLDMRLGEFLLVIRRRIKLSPERAIFMYIGDNHLVCSSNTFGYTYERYKNDDGFLYLAYSGESVFG